MKNGLCYQQLDLLIKLCNSVVTLSQFDLLFPAESDGSKNEHLLYLLSKKWVELRKGFVVFVAHGEEVWSTRERVMDEIWLSINRAGASRGLTGEALDYYVIQNLPAPLYEENHDHRELQM